jgi:hypothetical protein
MHGMYETIDYNDETIDLNEANIWPRLWRTINKDFTNLDEAARLRILRLVVGVCGTCHDNERDCACWNDE